MIKILPKLGFWDTFCPRTAQLTFFPNGISWPCSQCILFPYHHNSRIKTGRNGRCWTVAWLNNTVINLPHVMINIQCNVGRGSDGAEAVSLAAGNRHELKNATFTPQLRSRVSHTLWMKWRSESRRRDFTTGSLGVAVSVATCDRLTSNCEGGDERLDCGWQARGSCCNKSRARQRVVCCACGPKKSVCVVCWQEMTGILCAWVFFFFHVIKVWEDRNCCYKANRSPAARSQTLPANKRAHQQTWHALEEQEIGGFLTSLYSV